MSEALRPNIRYCYRVSIDPQKPTCYNVLMTKQQKKKPATKTNTKFQKSTMIISLVLNAIFVIGTLGLLIAYKSGTFDYAVVNKGVEKACSSAFREKIQADAKSANRSTNDTDLQLASIDYPCYANGSQEYYDQGFNEYAESIGLETAVD